MDGFSKISLDQQRPSSNLGQNSISMRRKKIKIGKRGLTILGVILALLVVFFVVVGIQTQTVLKDAKQTYSTAKLALNAFKQQNIEDASNQLNAAKPQLLQTQKDLQAMGYLNFVPIANFYYGDAIHLVQAGVYGLNAGQIMIDAIKPYADVLGLHGSGSFTGGSAQDRIQMAVTTMSKVTPKIDEIGTQLVLMQKEIDNVDPNHYPAIFGGKTIQDNLKNLKLGVDEASTFVTQAKPLIKVLPGMLGEPTEKKYLVLFQNDKELRPTGGFITAYAIFRLEHGVIHVDSSNDIYTLDATIGNKPVAPAPILKYLPKVPLWNLRDTNLSPDFVKSMNDFNSMYKRAGGYVPVEGIIAVDTHALVSAMDILGDIDADGVHFTTQIDPRCKCAQVIYALEEYTDTPVNYVKTNRKGIVGDLLYAIMQKAFQSSPKKYWGPLFQTMISEIAQKHILFDVNNPDAQSGLEALNASGRIMSFTGDYLHVNDANFGGAKSNLFLKESVSQSYDIKSDGTLTKTVTISYKNPFPPSDCNLERGGLCLNAVQRDWLRVYVPKGSKLISSQGSEVKVTTSEDLGKTVFEGFLTIRPLGAATYTLTYQLPFKLAGNSVLPLMIQKQPGTDGQEYTILVGTRQLDSMTLDTDKTLNLKLQ
ncbi:MAG TPA: DUF4012 domain-containing protein [Patescibacteria group bacterium]